MTDPKTRDGAPGGLTGRRLAAQDSRRRRRAASPSAARSVMTIPEGARPMLWRMAVLRTAEEARRLRAAASNTRADSRR